jgi:tyrosyl-tRNA synthetase
VGAYLRYFTLLRGRGGGARGAAANPGRREAQRALAEDVTRRVHGEAGLARARAPSEVLFGGGLEGLGADEIADIFADVPSSAVGPALEGEGLGIVDLLVGAGVPSPAARRGAGWSRAGST